MIFLDSNIILRYLTERRDAAAERMQLQAENLVLAVQRGEQQATLSEVVLHECSYVLASKHHDGVKPQEIADYLSETITMQSMRFPKGEKGLYLRALQIFRENPKLELADSLIAARSEHLQIPLATFDKALTQFPSLDSWFKG